MLEQPAVLGARYAQYKRAVRWRLIPLIW